MSDLPTPEAPDARMAQVGFEAVDQLAMVLADAFRTDPLACWLFPDARRPLLLRRMFAHDLRQRLGERSAVVAPPKLLAAAAWSGAQQCGRILELRQPGWPVMLPIASRKLQLEEVFQSSSTFHPNEPHVHLDVLGVHTAIRRRGTATALLAHGLAAFGPMQPIVATATTPRAVVLLQGYGFDIAHRRTVDSGPAIWTLVRPRPS
jgi:ribosomal protein S18 acetylase RimI-like enzyme